MRCALTSLVGLLALGLTLPALAGPPRTGTSKQVTKRPATLSITSDPTAGVTIGRKYRGRTPLKLKVEYGEDTREEELEALTEEITEEMHKRIKIRPKITWLPPKTLERFVKKKKLIEKAYEKE